jgi:hypothetical protein
MTFLDARNICRAVRRVDRAWRSVLYSSRGSQSVNIYLGIDRCCSSHCACMMTTLPFFSTHMHDTPRTCMIRTHDEPGGDIFSRTRESVKAHHRIHRHSGLAKCLRRGPWQRLTRRAFALRPSGSSAATTECGRRSATSRRRWLCFPRTRGYPGSSCTSAILTYRGILTRSRTRSTVRVSPALRDSEFFPALNLFIAYPTISSPLRFGYKTFLSVTKTSQFAVATSSSHLASTESTSRFLVM